MKLFRKIQKWFENQENLYYLFLIILIVPNIVLCFTEPMPLVAKVCNVLLPFSIYHMIMSWSGNCGKTFWILFPFLFFGAFQIVLLYLFGQSVFASVSDCIHCKSYFMITLNLHIFGDNR